MAKSSKSKTLTAFTPPERAKAFDYPITPSDAMSRLKNAGSDAVKQTAMFETMMRDDAVGNACDQRILGIAGARWAFEVPADAEGAEVDPAQAAALTAGLPPRRWRRVLEHLAGFRLYGYAVAQVVWAPDWTPLYMEAVPYASTECLEGVIYVVMEDGSKVDVTDPKVADNLLVVKADDNDPASAARLRRAVVPWLIKSFLFRDWAAYSERFGSPWIKGSYKNTAAPPQGYSSIGAYVAEILETVRAHGVLGVPDWLQVELLEAAQGDASAALERLHAVCDRAIYVGIIGQDSTVNQATDGSRASDEVREGVLDMLVEADTAILCEALQEQLVDKVAAARGGYDPADPLAPRPILLSYSWRGEESTGERAEVMVKAKSAGIPFDHEEARRELGLAAPSPEQLAEEERRRQEAAAMFGGGSGTEKASRLDPELVLLRYMNGESKDALASLAEDGQRQLAEKIISVLVPAVQRAIPEGATPEEADRAILSVLQRERVRPLAQVFSEVILAGAYNGRANSEAWLRRIHKQKKGEST